jgi:creatinine amidohydrolase
MNWENLTGPEFEAAVEKCGRVCLLPLGVVEKHGDHLPLGMDTIYIHDICTRAAKRETAMVFPQFYFGQILEARHVPGTIALRFDMLLPLLENVCDEIGRNGFTRIILVNGHGGNTHMLRCFGWVMLEKEKRYTTYLSNFAFEDARVRKASVAKVDGHGGEAETSSMLYQRPELVHFKRFADYGLPLGRARAFRKAGLESSIFWYSDYPGHFSGEKVPCTRAKGKLFVEAHARHIAKQIKLVKSDDTLAELYREFHGRTGAPANRYP